MSRDTDFHALCRQEKPEFEDRASLCQIDLLGSVGPHVEELPRISLGREPFPVANLHGSIAFVKPPEAVATNC